ncbi:hypothetical protein HID58_060638 [Brassica napus]|uniref:Myb/SANT-like DNA-binding domain-containing protein n=1 Tax=Brassica napus TaxID=3708 RepID=A0ABQ7ZWX1_BRANA|nr:hypothetical protein HID58_060638 [Brassica napus]
MKKNGIYIYKNMFASSCTVTGSRSESRCLRRRHNLGKAFRDWDLWGPFFFKPAKSPSRLDSAGSVLRQGFRVSGNPERLRSTADSFVQSLEGERDENSPQEGMVCGGALSYGSFDLQGSMRVHHHNPNSRPLESLSFTVVTAQTCNHNMPLTEQHKGERENNSVSYDHEPSFSEEGGDGDDLSMDGGSRRKFAALQRKSKWKFVFEVLFERGYHVSPQQCEDKFNDLNKRFKKLNDNRLNLHHDLALQHSVKLAFRNIDDQENDDFRNH